MKIKNKLLGSYIIIILFVITFYSYYIYYKEKHFITETMIKTVEQSEMQVTSYLNYKLYYIDRIIDTFVSNDSINGILKRQYKGENMNLRLRSQREVSYELIKLSKSTEIDAIHIYCLNDFLIGHQSQFVRSFEKHLSEAQRQKLMEQSKRINWKIDQKQGKVVGTLWIMDNNNYQRKVALLELVVKTDEIEQLIDISNIYNEGASFILNDEGEILIESLKGNSNKSELFRNLLLDTYKEDETEGVFLTKDKRYIIGINKKLHNGWKMITFIDYKSAMKHSYSNVYLELLMVIVSSALFAYLLAFLMANKITRPIVQISKQMKKITKGNLNAKLNIIMDDEIGLLIKNYNNMVENLDKLVQERFNNGLEARKQELMALEAQINPHFLYNTLDSINWYAIKSNLPVISEMVKDLAKFYRLSLNNGNFTISIGEEIQYLQVYLKLMNLRYNNLFDVNFEIDEALQDFRIIKLIFQPILENAIVHGILSSEQEKGLIKIAASKKDESIIFSISDNGKGMTLEEQERVMKKSETGGYGMFNVKERLNVYYQNKASIYFESQIDVGTTFYIQIPINQ